MLKRIFIILVSNFLIFRSSPVYSKDFSNKTIEKYIYKVANKFSRTYCNTSKFGISEEGALAFAIGETKKEFKNNKFNKLINYSLLVNDIVGNLEDNCQVYNFPVQKLEKLKLE